MEKEAGVKESIQERKDELRHYIAEISKTKYAKALLKRTFSKRGAKALAKKVVTGAIAGTGALLGTKAAEKGLDVYKKKERKYKRRKAYQLKKAQQMSESKTKAAASAASKYGKIFGLGVLGGAIGTTKAYLKHRAKKKLKDIAREQEFEKRIKKTGKKVVKAAKKVIPHKAEN